ncbi:MAG: 1-acyl-sn-glycerol-3-phosphate acyltransferase [Gammaproteobacteria bacterium]|nr:1-acyl-sn-glycerol-3-phosphate acyltransferase [Gammaproteobacteria bacterium]
MLNLLIGVGLLIPVAIINLLIPVPMVSKVCFFFVKVLYRWCVLVDSFWMKRVVGIELEVVGEAESHPSPVVICNHQSWFDIPLIQEVVASRGPIVKFLVKEELVWVPIIGWICLSLNFPRLKRGKKSGDRKSDFSIIEKTSKSHGNDGALLVFPEGTRFTNTKRLDQKSPYKNLLKPRAGGLNVIKNNMDPNTPLVDITIDYGDSRPNIWKCLHGNPAKIKITVAHFKLAELSSTEDWLNNRWYEKDKILTDAK